MRQMALETMGKTHKRNSEEGSTCTRVKKSRKNGTGALEYLKETVQQDRALKQEELELKKTRKWAVAKHPDTADSDV